jgi:hypothetical protein
LRTGAFSLIAHLITAFGGASPQGEAFFSCIARPGARPVRASSPCFFSAAFSSLRAERVCLPLLGRWRAAVDEVFLSESVLTKKFFDRWSKNA